jgi:hypothetical protein
MTATYKTIEQVNNVFTVYEIGEYGEDSVLAGQQMRVFLDSFNSLDQARKAFPDANSIKGSTYREPCLDHLSDGPDNY